MKPPGNERRGDRQDRNEADAEKIPGRGDTGRPGDPGDPGELSEPGAIYVCEICGAEMFESHCKIICPRCGYRRDCSDP